MMSANDPALAQLRDTPDPDTASAVEVDMRYLHGSPRRHGDITSMLTWNFAELTPSGLLMLAPGYAPKLGEELQIVTIRQNEAWKWSRDHNNDAEMVGLKHETRNVVGGDKWQETMAGRYAYLLNLSPHDPATRHRIRGIIEDQLGDLVSMPPPPKRYKVGRAEFTLSSISTGKVISEQTVEGN